MQPIQTTREQTYFNITLEMIEEIEEIESLIYIYIHNSNVCKLELFYHSIVRESAPSPSRHHAAMASSGKAWQKDCRDNHNRKSTHKPLCKYVCIFDLCALIYNYDYDDNLSV